MNNLEKMVAVGQAIYGSTWQSSLARALNINDRTVRSFISGRSRIPTNLSIRLLEAMESEMNKIKSAVEIIESDAVNGEDVTTDVIDEIVNRYTYESEHDRKCAIDAVNNAIYEKTYLSDLDAIARKFSE